MADNQFPTDPQTQAAFDSAAEAAPSVDQEFETAAQNPVQNREPATQPTQEPQKAPETPVNVINPAGKLVSIPKAQLYDAINSGYKPASTEEVDKHFKSQEFGTLGQRLLTGAEGAAEAASFGLSGAAENALAEQGLSELSPERRLARREENPGSHALGQIAGLGASALIPGVGEANIIRGAGEAAAGALGLAEGASALAKIGSAATKLAVENALVSSGDEVAKMLAQDPNQTAQTALTNIGLSGVIGGGLGAALGSVSPLWKATMGSKVGGVLKGIADKVGGIDQVVPDAVNDAIETSGIAVAPEVRAGLSNDPEIRQMFQHLQESATGSGIKAQEALKQFRGDASNAIVSALGKTPEEVANLGDMSEYEAGQNVKSALINHLKEQIDPISEQFDKIKSQFKETALAQDGKALIGDKIGQLAASEGYNLSPSAPQARLINRVLEELPNVKTLEDLRKYTSVISDNATTPELWRVGSQLKSIFREAEETSLDKALGDKAPELLEQHAQARVAYKNAMNTIDELNDRLHVGRFGGPSSFIKALNEMSPEDVLRRLSPKGDAGIIGELTTKFPNAANQVKDYYVSQALRSAAQRAGEGETINSKVFFNALQKMSPEMRNFLVSPEGSAKLEAIQGLIEGLPSKMNTSGTAKTLDSLWSHVPNSAVGLATLLGGHEGAGAALLLGNLTKWIGRDIPDAARLATLKFLGSNKPINAEGFKAMADYIATAIKGQNITGRAIKNVFRSGADVIPQYLHPTEQERKKVDKAVKEAQANPQSLMNVGGQTAHYLPEHNQAIAQTSQNVINYLAKFRPDNEPKSPLDPKLPVSPWKQAEYNQILNVAQQPLTVLDRIQKGTVTSKEVAALQNMYPALYSKISQGLVEQIHDHVEKGKTIPYQTRMGVSLFLGQPLDSTMTPAAIMAAQPQPPQAQPQTATQPASNPKRSMNAINKLPGMYQTTGQASESHRQQGKS